MNKSRTTTILNRNTRMSYERKKRRTTYSTFVTNKNVYLQQ